MGLSVMGLSLGCNGSVLLPLSSTVTVLSVLTDGCVLILVLVFSGCDAALPLSSIGSTVCIAVSLAVSICGLLAG